MLKPISSRSTSTPSEQANAEAKAYSKAVQSLLDSIEEMKKKRELKDPNVAMIGRVGYNAKILTPSNSSQTLLNPFREADKDVHTESRPLLSKQEQPPVSIKIPEEKENHGCCSFLFFKRRKLSSSPRATASLETSRNDS